MNPLLQPSASPMATRITQRVWGKIYTNSGDSGSGVAGSGFLQATFAEVPESEIINLSALGQLDWAHFGLNDADDRNEKTGSDQIGPLVRLHNGVAGRWYGEGTQPAWGWTDGTPVAAVEKTQGYFDNPLSAANAGDGYSGSVAAIADACTAVFWVRTYKTFGAFRISLSDGAAQPIQLNLGDAVATKYYEVLVTFKTDSVGHNLVFEWEQADDAGNVGFAAIALASGNTPIELTTIEWTPAALTLEEGATDTAIAVASDQYGQPMAGTLLNLVANGVTATPNPVASGEAVQITALNAGGDFSLLAKNGDAVGVLPITINAATSLFWSRDFSVTQSLGVGGTCDRDSSGQYRNDSGVWQSAGVDVARFDHNGTAYALLNEPAGATNLYWPSAAAVTKNITVDGGVLADDSAGVTSLGTFRTNGDWQKYAAKWTPGANATVQSARVELLRNGSPTGNVWLEIIRVSDGALIATSGTMAASAVSASPTWTKYTFAFSGGAAVVSGVPYYVAICADFAYSSTNRLQIRTRADDSAVFFADAYRWNGSAWITAGTYHTPNLTLYATGAEYVVWMHGTGSVALTGALTGTVSAGSPVTGVAAGSNTLTCTVTGSIDHLQIEAGDTPTSRIATVTAAASRADETISWVGVDPDNTAEIVVDGVIKSVTGWNGSLDALAYAGRVSSINVWHGPPTERYLASIVVSPGSCTIPEGGTQQFTASGFDQLGASFDASGGAWTASGGSISAGGLFTGSAAGTYQVTYTKGAVSGTASASVQDVSGLPAEAQAELDWLNTNVPAYTLVNVPSGSGTTTLDASKSITIEDIRGLTIDSTPPVMSGPSASYPDNMRDDMGVNAPYVATNIPAFRLNYFKPEFNYTGWYNYQMMEYASLHGFESIAPYVMTTAQKDPFPNDANWLKWGYFIDWKTWCANNGVPWGRWDLFYDADPRTKVLANNPAWAVEPNTVCMLDIEQASALSPDNLRAQSWYPSTGTTAEKEAFEDKYYEGFSLHHSVMAEAATAKGWPSTGIYPQLYNRGWYEMLGAPTVEVKDPATDYKWAQMGVHAVPKQDVLYPDNYVYFWDSRNVGYVLAHQDYILKCVNTLPENDRRPVRPYLWPLLHGGDNEYHWWNQQPLPTEDMRAMYLLTLLVGNDGVALWNWSGTCNHHKHRPVVTQPNYDASVGTCSDYGKRGLNSDLQVGTDFSWVQNGGTVATVIKRYDVLLVTAFDGTNVTFKRVPTANNAGTTLNRGNITITYTMPLATLSPYLRPSTEPLEGAIEGLALAKVIEYIAYHGVPQPDPTAVNRWTQRKVLVRHTKLGALNVIATYDPNVPYVTQPVGEGAVPAGDRMVDLTDFGGVTGRTLTLAADEQTRLYFVWDAAVV